ncbi:MAG: EscR/YscR/HrcR family type III secretion system export apparatus protein [Chlamydiia bacterium]|nr:EscR/YscR/HrcR family type III secretion system export apparatus protein [Chlamydiia bacterium]
MSLLGCACASGISLANMNSESFIDEAAKGPSLMTELVALFSMALIPMFVILFSAFIKISIVSSLLRSAIGTQQAPANQVINGMSIIMSIYVLYPTFNEAYISIKGMEERMPATAFSRNSSIYVVKAINVAKEPFRKFLSKNSADSQKDIFLQLAYQSFSKDMPVGSDSFIILMPAFIMTQVRDGFVIGALIYMPFFVTDMLVSIILTALGMMMMAPLAIALPMKVFLIVFLNGWSLIITGLVKSFA